MLSFMGLHTSQALPVASCAGENLGTGAGGGFFNPFGICDQLTAHGGQLDSVLISTVLPRNQENRAVLLPQTGKSVRRLTSSQKGKKQPCP